MRKRPKISAARYERVWTSEGSPLRGHTARQPRCRAIWHQAARSARNRYAMRYEAVDAESSTPYARKVRAHLILPCIRSTGSQTGSARTRVPHLARDPPYRGAKVDASPAIRLHPRARSEPARIGETRTARRPRHDFTASPPSVDRGGPLSDECRKRSALDDGRARERVSRTLQSRFGGPSAKPYTFEVRAELGQQRRARRRDLPGLRLGCIETPRRSPSRGRRLSGAGGASCVALLNGGIGTRPSVAWSCAVSRGDHGYSPRGRPQPSLVFRRGLAAMGPAGPTPRRPLLVPLAAGQGLTLLEFAADPHLSRVKERTVQETRHPDPDSSRPQPTAVRPGRGQTGRADRPEHYTLLRAKAESDTSQACQPRSQRHKFGSNSLQSAGKDSLEAALAPIIDRRQPANGVEMTLKS